jgi:hypothetical protein
MTDHWSLLTFEDRMKAMQENKYQEEKGEQQQRNETYLSERGRRFAEATCAVPSEATVATWRDEYIDT